jgi:hypothetical protein
MAKDYVPQNAAAFYKLMRALLDYVNSRSKSWKHIPAEPRTTLEKAFLEFATAYDATIGEHTRSQLLARREAQSRCTKLLRAFVNQYLRFEPVTNIDRTAMGIPNREESRTERIEVRERIDFELRLRHIRELQVFFKQADANHKAKPTGYDGAVVQWHISETQPSNASDFKFHAMASRTPFTIKFEEADRGKRVWVTLCWQNRRGNRGDFAKFKSALIP